MLRSEGALTDLGDDSKEKVEREGESAFESSTASGASRVAASSVAPAALGKALGSLEVEDGRDMVAGESLTECGMLRGYNALYGDMRALREYMERCL